MKKQFQIFIAAIMFYTKIPVRIKTVYSDEVMNSSTRYLPFIGWVAGGAGALVYGTCSYVMPEPLGVFFAMTTVVLLTGAFHEDGFADFCDGFGGGYTREKILAIMKDSHIGTYGVIGVVSMLAARFGALVSIQDFSIPLVLLAAHSFSRLMPVIVINSTAYARPPETSKIKAIGHKGKPYELIIASVFGLTWLCFIPITFVLAIIPASLLTTYIFRMYLNRKIGGYTGDCLGALQQIIELEFYLGMVIFQH